MFGDLHPSVTQGVETVVIFHVSRADTPVMVWKPGGHGTTPSGMTCYDIKGPQRTKATSFGVMNQLETDTFTITSWGHPLRTTGLQFGRLALQNRRLEVCVYRAFANTIPGRSVASRPLRADASLLRTVDPARPEGSPALRAAAAGPDPGSATYERVRPDVGGVRTVELREAPGGLLEFELLRGSLLFDGLARFLHGGPSWRLVCHRSACPARPVSAAGRPFVRRGPRWIEPERATRRLPDAPDPTSGCLGPPPDGLPARETVRGEPAWLLSWTSAAAEDRRPRSPRGCR
jgi:hypothetical protein